MARDQRNFAIAAWAGSGRFGHLGLLQGVAGRHLPAAGDVTGEAEFEPLAALLAAQDERAAAVGVGYAGVGTVELVDGYRSQQPVNRLPLGADLVIVEPLGLQRLGVD